MSSSSVWRVTAPRPGDGRSEPTAAASPRTSRVLFVATELRDDCLGHCILRLARELRRRGLAVGLLCGGGALLSQMEGLGVHPMVSHRLGGAGEPRIVSWKALAYTREFAPQIIHLFSCALATWGMKLSRATGIPYALTLLTFPASAVEERLPGHWKLGTILAGSEKVRESLVNQGRIPKDAIGVIPMGIAVEDYERYAEPDGRDRIPVVGTIGPLIAGRGCEQFLHAAKVVLDRGHEAHFLIAGDGPERDRLRELVRTLNIEKWVTLIYQFADYRQMLSILDICVLPALEEGVALAAMEAMACRKPVVASGVGDAYDVIEDGITGFLAPKRDAATMAEKIIRLIEDRGLAHRIAEAAYSNVRDRFSLGASIESLLGFYAWCVGRSENA